MLRNRAYGRKAAPFDGNLVDTGKIRNEMQQAAAMVSLEAAGLQRRREAEVGRLCGLRFGLCSAAEELQGSTTLWDTRWLS